jgi:hypothetical protein
MIDGEINTDMGRRLPDLTTFRTAHDAHEAALMQRATDGLPGMELTVFPNQTEEDINNAAVAFGYYGQTAGHNHNSWEYTARQIQQAGGHIVKLIVRTAEAPDGRNVKPFENQLAALRKVKKATT